MCGHASARGLRRKSGSKLPHSKNGAAHMSTMNSKNKPNGHAALLAKGGGANSTISSGGMGRAASVDASELPVACATASSAVASAGREACADVAQAPGKGKRLPVAGAASQSHDEKNGSKETSTAKRSRKLPPGREPLPIDGEAFVDAVHSRVDLVLVEVKLLKSTDHKIAQRELAYLRELRYGKRAAPAGDEVPQIIVDMPGPGEDNTP